MEQREGFRHELKYGIGYPRYLEIQSRLRRVMRTDPHGDAAGRYLIRSIYFDNFTDKALREKVYGVPCREKFRIRYYNDDFSFILLEKKVKEDSLCRKYDAEIAEGECRRLLKGDTGWMRGHPAALVRELYAKMGYQALRPRVLVSYVREAYLYGPGNVRITFDSHIRSGMYCRDFLGEGRTDVSVGEAPGDMVLEVKYDAFLPSVIRDLVQTGGLRQQAFSKYGASRRFG